MRFILVGCVGLTISSPLLAGPYPVEQGAPRQLGGRLAISPDGKLLVLTYSDRSPEGQKGSVPLLRMVETETGKDVCSFLGHRSHIMYVAFTPDGKRLVSLGGEATYRIWDVRTGKQLHCLEADLNSRIGVSTSGKDLLLGTTNSSGKFRMLLWNVETGEVGKNYDLNYPFVPMFLTFSRDDKRVLLRDNGSCCVFDLEKGSLIKSLGLGYRNGNGMCLTADGKHLIFERIPALQREEERSKQRHLVMWSVDEDEQDRRFPPRRLTWYLPLGDPFHNDPDRLLLTPDGAQVLVFEEEGLIRCWHLGSGKECWLAAIRGRQPSFDSQRAFVAGGKELVLFSIHSMRELNPLNPALVWEQRRTVTLCFYDLATGKQLRDFNYGIDP